MYWFFDSFIDSFHVLCLHCLEQFLKTRFLSVKGYRGGGARRTSDVAFSDSTGLHGVSMIQRSFKLQLLGIGYQGPQDGVPQNRSRRTCWPSRICGLGNTSVKSTTSSCPERLHLWGKCGAVRGVERVRFERGWPCGGGLAEGHFRKTRPAAPANPLLVRPFQREEPLFCRKLWG